VVGGESGGEGDFPELDRPPEDEVTGEHQGAVPDERLIDLVKKAEEDASRRKACQGPCIGKGYGFGMTWWWGAKPKSGDKESEGAIVETLVRARDRARREAINKATESCSSKGGSRCQCSKTSAKVTHDKYTILSTRMWAFYFVTQRGGYEVPVKRGETPDYMIIARAMAKTTLPVGKCQYVAS
jgi:hypothetical protein